MIFGRNRRRKNILEGIYERVHIALGDLDAKTVLESIGIIKTLYIINIIC